MCEIGYFWCKIALAHSLFVAHLYQYVKTLLFVAMWEGCPCPGFTFSVTESTIIATIHCPDIGYCLFGISLVMHIPYHVPCTFLIVIVSYWVVLPLLAYLLLLLPVPNWDTLRFLLCITGLVHQ